MAPTRFHWLLRAAVLLLVVTVVAIILIASGVFDPTPLGSLQWELAEEQLSVAPQSRDIIWLEEEVPDSTFTTRITGALNSGEEDSGYGLVLGDEDNYLAVAVSPLGYLAIWESDALTGEIKDSFFLQWQTWPHVKTGNAANEIWVDIAGDRATVRVNREWLWEGDVGTNTRRVGLMGESFADSAIIDFMNVELFAGNDK